MYNYTLRHDLNQAFFIRTMAKMAATIVQNFELSPNSLGGVASQVNYLDGRIRYSLVQLILKNILNKICFFSFLTRHNLKSIKV